MKKLRILVTTLIFILLPCMCILPACSYFNTSPNVYITDIKKNTKTEGLVDTYTVYYSNGSTSQLTITNGKDGEDGQNLTLNDVKDFCEENGYNFNAFLNDNFMIYGDNDKTKIYDALQSTVSVVSECGTPSSPGMSRGAGVIYKMTPNYSYLITNYHVVYDEANENIARAIHVFQYGTSEAYAKTGSYHKDGYPVISYDYGAIECEYVGGSISYDIAILKVPTSELKQYNSYVKEVSIAESYNIADDAIAIGNPNGEGISVTAGIVSKESEPILCQIDDTAREYRVLRIDTAINSGNSGGGLFNENGELIGIVNAKSIEEYVDNISFALPIDCVKKVADNLIYYYEKDNKSSTVKKLYLGIEVSDRNCRAEYITLKSDITVEKVTENSFAKLAGLKLGDIITSCKIVHADNQIEDTVFEYRLLYQLQESMLTVREGDTIYLYGTRNNSANQLLASKQISLSSLQDVE